ncbi:MAG: hypothetical protein WEC33_00385 [Dehalococcoidia bacterium]
MIVRGMLEKVTRETFAPLKGHAFTLSGPEGSVELTLVAVQGNGLRGGAGREQFSLHFQGPREPFFPQSIYHLENATLGPLDIFLVPIARDELGATYEAIFT